MQSEAESWLVEYLNEVTIPYILPRVMCCESSRSIYCPICCKILVPSENWPDIDNINLPFDVDIILDGKERRTSATGLHAAAIICAASTKKIQSDNENCDGINDNNNDKNYNNNNKPAEVHLIDIAKGETPPIYKEEDGVYILYPGKNSVPISSLNDKIKKLIVLDCKWSRTSVRLHPTMVDLPQVRLSCPPKESYFWRWHNSGDGMLSTIEAIYFAAYETAHDWDVQEKRNLLKLMWLFALQRKVISERSMIDQRTLPFSEEGKEQQRALRRLQRTKGLNRDDKQLEFKE